MKTRGGETLVCAGMELMRDMACWVFMRANTTDAFKGQVAGSEVMLFGEWNKHYLDFVLGRFFFLVFVVFVFVSLFFFFFVSQVWIPTLLNQNCFHHPDFAQSLWKIFCRLLSVLQIFSSAFCWGRYYFHTTLEILSVENDVGIDLAEPRGQRR